MSLIVFYGGGSPSRHKKLQEGEEDIKFLLVYQNRVIPHTQIWQMVEPHLTNSFDECVIIGHAVDSFKLFGESVEGVVEFSRRVFVYRSKKKFVLIRYIEPPVLPESPRKGMLYGCLQSSLWLSSSNCRVLIYITVFFIVSHDYSSFLRSEISLLSWLSI